MSQKHSHTHTLQAVTIPAEACSGGGGRDAFSSRLSIDNVQDVKGKEMGFD